MAMHRNRCWTNKLIPYQLEAAEEQVVSTDIQH
jgi:hypothetical protein